VDRATGLGAVHVTIDDPNAPRLPVGAFGTARVSSGEPRAVKFVPSAAVRSATGGTSEVVVCGKDNKAHVLSVHPGADRDGRVVVDCALQKTDRVATAPVVGLSEGDEIEAQP